jgi:hypothetical protein
MEVGEAAERVFREKGYIQLAVVLSIVFLLIYISIPVFVVPGNDYKYYFSVTPIHEHVFSLILSVIMGIVFTMQIYSWKNSISIVKNAGMGFVGFFSGTISTIFASATCVSCITAIFSFIGFGTVNLLLEHKTEIMLMTLGIVLASLYFTSRKINGKCKSCFIPKPEKSVKNREHKKADQ